MGSNLVGARIRAYRAMKKWTQQQLSDLAGIPRATLATVERDDANPTLSVVFRIAQALGVTVNDLLQELPAPIQVIRGAEMRETRGAEGAYRAVTSSPPGAFHFLQQTFTLAGMSRFEGAPHPAGSEEYLLVLEGTLELEAPGERVTLHRGDAARFSGNVSHTYHNPGQREARAVVTIVQGPGRELAEGVTEAGG